jgi:UDP-N-acetylglucosamine 1-carboxyvinyltransferase
MDKIKIRGGKKLSGSIDVSGSKNAALPILFSSLVSNQKSVYRNVPVLQDIRTTIKLLNSIGCECVFNEATHEITIDNSKVNKHEAPYDLVRTMRASVLVLGPLVAKYGRAKVSLPGGCAIGTRPINFHLEALEKLGATIHLEGGYVIAEAKKLRGNKVTFPFPSVGATENILMAAAIADGESVLENCALEPEITDLARALKTMGAKIEGEGTPTLRIQGNRDLKGADHSVMGDRIEAGTFLIAGFMTGGAVTVEGLAPEYLESVLVKLEHAGANVKRNKNSIEVKSNGRLKATDIETAPFPGFPTDMQAQFMAAMTIANGESTIIENIFENRYMHVPELNRLGADIQIQGNKAVVHGKEKLLGAPLTATDLRASASLILGGLCAAGETIVNRVYHLDRGYENVEKKLRSIGADIERIP